MAETSKIIGLQGRIKMSYDEKGESGGKCSSTTKSYDTKTKKTGHIKGLKKTEQSIGAKGKQKSLAQRVAPPSNPQAPSQKKKGG